MTALNIEYNYLWKYSRWRALLLAGVCECHSNPSILDFVRLSYKEWQVMLTNYN